MPHIFDFNKIKDVNYRGENVEAIYYEGKIVWIKPGEEDDAGFYDADGNLIVSWKESGFKNSDIADESSWDNVQAGISFIMKVQEKYPDTKKIIFPKDVSYIGQYQLAEKDYYNKENNYLLCFNELEKINFNTGSTFYNCSGINLYIKGKWNGGVSYYNVYGNGHDIPLKIETQEDLVLENQYGSFYFGSPDISIKAKDLQIKGQLNFGGGESAESKEYKIYLENLSYFRQGFYGPSPRDEAYRINCKIIAKDNCIFDSFSFYKLGNNSKFEILGENEINFLPPSSSYWGGGESSFHNYSFYTNCITKTIPAELFSDRSEPSQGYDADKIITLHFKEIENIDGGAFLYSYPCGIDFLIDNKESLVKIGDNPLSGRYSGYSFQYVFLKSYSFLSSVKKIVGSQNFTGYTSSKFTDPTSPYCYQFWWKDIHPLTETLDLKNLEEWDDLDHEEENSSFAQGNFKYLGDRFKTVILNGKIKLIPYDTFYNTAFKYINIPEGIEEIRSSAFQNSYPELSNVTEEIILPSTLKKIKSSAFSHHSKNEKIKTVVIPSTVETIEAGAFSNLPIHYNGNDLPDGAPWGAYKFTYGAQSPFYTMLTTNDVLDLNLIGQDIELPTMIEENAVGSFSSDLYTKATLRNKYNIKTPTEISVIIPDIVNKIYDNTFSGVSHIVNLSSYNEGFPWGAQQKHKPSRSNGQCTCQRCSWICPSHSLVESTFEDEDAIICQSQGEIKYNVTNEKWEWIKSTSSPKTVSATWTIKSLKDQTLTMTIERYGYVKIQINLNGSSIYSVENRGYTRNTAPLGLSLAKDTTYQLEAKYEYLYSSYSAEANISFGKMYKDSLGCLTCGYSD